jgi:Lrp/AsnC family leucine-responsive transcriptional regulator
MKDKFDERILRELQRDGRISNAELAERIGLSASATLRRVQELERIGIIEGYRARLSREKMGIGFTAYITVGLNNHTKQAQKAFENAINQSPEVIECHNITGVVEYLLRIETRDLASYKQFHTEVLGTLPQVASINTYVVMESSKDTRA